MVTVKVQGFLFFGRCRIVQLFTLSWLYCSTPKSQSLSSPIWISHPFSSQNWSRGIHFPAHFLQMCKFSTISRDVYQSTWTSRCPYTNKIKCKDCVLYSAFSLKVKINIDEWFSFCPQRTKGYWAWVSSWEVIKKVRTVLEAHHLRS